jgi:ABC-type dipeptide/oligopeptide/nickel transport system permease subunit
MVTVTVLGNNLFTVVLAISVGVVPRFARVTRGTILSIRERDYVEAARALGASPPRIIWSYVLLNAVDPLIVLCTLLIPTAILTEALLSFLGLGVPPPQADWGGMASEGLPAIRYVTHIVTFPSIALSITLLAFNFFGDGLRDAFDPRQKR